MKSITENGDLTISLESIEIAAQFRDDRAMESV